MKAKVIKTGETVHVYHEPQHGQTNIYKESVLVNGRMWTEDELDFCAKTSEAPQQYIKKSALLAEIKRLDALYNTSKDLSGDLFIQGLFCFLDTTEVKKVDLEKENV